MNYQKIYDSLVKRGRSRAIQGYTESHHIVPRCLGGSDESDNLVDLTPEEHYLAHQLLVKMYPNCPPLANAAMMMTAQRPSNKVYGWLRRRVSKVMSDNQSGKGNSQYGTKWIYSIELKSNRKIPKEYPVPEGWHLGRKTNWKTIYKKCPTCDIEFVVTSKEKYCSDECREEARKSRIDYYGREEEFLKLYETHGSMNKALKAMGYPGAMSHWYKWAKSLVS